MIDFERASALVREAARPLGSERVRLEMAHGRVLAAPVVACIDAPRANVSAMDGYAVCSRDIADGPAILRVAGRSFPGQPWQGVLGPGECVRIFTGGPAPAGADRVIIQEHATQDGDQVRLEARGGDAAHLRLQGSDFRAGDVVLAQGRRLDARALVAAAAADVAAVSVCRRPRVILLATGDELVAPGDAAQTRIAVPDSISIAVEALARESGAGWIARRRLPDDPTVMTASAREAAADFDVVVVIGGASVGDRDLAKSMLAPLGLELMFAKVAIKPGKPVWFGRTGGAWVLGLPGNPTSAFVTARLFLHPLVAGLAGRDPVLAWREAPAGQDFGVGGPRDTFVRGRRLAEGGVVALADQDTSSQRALATADILIRRRPGAPKIARGEAVEVLEL